MTVKITIDGPGGVINYELEVIKQALEDRGVTVKIDNDAPEDDPISLLEVIDERLKSGYIEEKLVEIKVCHRPWGG